MKLVGLVNPWNLRFSFSIHLTKRSTGHANPPLSLILELGEMKSKHEMSI